ncbi:zinc metalloprotease HtpX [Candidatus Uhrbacteria bacterium]|nr:zinc metalloprotease HtpX [Candidatus Uhrbacteria bacterium]
MYKQIDSNRHKSWLLIAIFIGVLAAVGYIYGYVTDTGSSGLIFTLIISLGMTSISWFSGDKIVLWQSGAQEISDREQNRYLWNMVENLAITAGIPKPRIYLVNDPSPNAFATGRDPKHASVTVTTGILNLLTNEELEGVIAHELSHVKNFDTRMMMLAAVLVGAIVLLSDIFIRGSLFGGQRRSNDRGSGNGIFMIVGIILLVLSPLIGQLIQLAVSRRREFLADADGALLTRYPEGLARALAKIRDAHQPMTRPSRATAHLWIANPFGDGRIRSHIATLFSTHPPIEERIKQLRLMESAK